jgi:S-(hydroxymethyl)glutathione dehydrogenase/alcohol dehydrogenase
MSGWHGMTVILGHGINESMNAFQPVDFVSGDRIITGCAMGGIRMNVTDDIPALVELYQTGHLKLDELISRHYSLEQINEAIEDAEKGDTLRNVIMF